MRLAGKAKAGFYPTPLSVTADIIRILNIQGSVRVLDTCCGEGKVLADIKAAFPLCETYGVELDNNRYAVAKRCVDKCLCCDSVAEFSATNGAFDILWENPPYDDDISDDDTPSMRIEKKFLQSHAKYLKTKGGILIYIIPFHVLKQLKHMLEKYHDLRVFAFPEKEYRVFKQVVVMGRTSNFASSDILSKNRTYLEDIINNVDCECAYEYLTTTDECDALFDVYPSGLELKTFYTSRINPEEAIELLKNSPVSKFFQNIIDIKSINSIKPLSDLTEGHLAMLIASGMMDGLLESNGERLVINGRVREKFTKREESDDEKTKVISRKKYEVSVNVLNLTTEKMTRVRA